MTSKFLKLCLFLIPLFLLSSCKKKTETQQLTPTPAPKLIEIDMADRPYISLIPRADGHEIKLVVEKIPDFINEIEYELVYTAIDDELDIQIEKGLNGTPEISNGKIERDLLLGTESCTNGCKYKYDAGVNGGYLILNFITSDNQKAIYQSDFVLSQTADIKKNGLKLNDLEIVATPKQTEYFILLQNYNQQYSVFSSGNGLATITSISPDYKKEDKTKLTGDYSQ